MGQSTTVSDLQSFKREVAKALAENVLRFLQVDQTTGHRQIQRERRLVETQVPICEIRGTNPR